MIHEIKGAADYIQSQIETKPEIALILGSGLGVLGEEIEEGTVIKYEDIPDFPVSTVEGHAGQFVVGKLEGKKVMAMQGRFHYYEGYNMQQIALPIRVIY